MSKDYVLSVSQISMLVRSLDRHGYAKSWHNDDLTTVPSALLSGVDLSNEPVPDGLDLMVENWCVETRFDWQAWFSQWTHRFYLNQALPAKEIDQFVASIDQRLPVAEKIVRLFEIQIETQVGATNIELWNARLEQLKTYLHSIKMRRSLASLLDADYPAKSAIKVLQKLSASYFPGMLQSYSFAESPSVMHGCIRGAIYSLVHGLAFWVRELENEAGPWVRATAYHLDQLNSIHSDVHSFAEVAEGLLADKVSRDAIQGGLFFTYIKDEIDSLKDIVGAEMISLRPLNEEPENNFNEIDIDDENRAEECMRNFVLPRVKERLNSSIRLLNDFQHSQLPTEEMQEDTSLFIPRLQWVFFIANSTDHLLEDENEVDELPEFIAELIPEEDATIDSQVGFESRLTMDDCDELRNHYAEMFDSWLATRVDGLRQRPHNERTEILSAYVRKIGHPGKDLTFRPGIRLELADRLQIGNGNLSEVFNLLHNEVALFVINAPYKRPWGELHFQEGEGLVLTPSS